MRVLISGTGRGGTNLLTELVRKITTLTFTEDVEDRRFFLNPSIRDNYGTKLTMDHPTFTIDRARQALTAYPDLKILFSVRHPLDNCLSKIVRGQKASDGGDKVTENISADATVPTALRAIEDLYQYIQALASSHPSQIVVVKMEDVITNTEKVVEILAKFLDITPLPHEGFHRLNRNKYQKSRYGNTLTPQTNLYKDLDTNFNGFYVDKPEIVEALKNRLKKYINVYYEE